jgi:hypothetical protein
MSRPFRFRIATVLALLLSFGLALAMVIRKAGADAAPPVAGTESAALDGGGGQLPLSPPPKTVQALTESLSATEAAADKGTPLERAEVTSQGGVPTHSQGRFRSPFADPTTETPARVRVAMLLNDVRTFDIKEGTFVADFFLSMSSDRPIPAKNFAFTNGTESSKQVLADTPTFKLFRYTGSFATEIDLRQYPFDTQDLTIEIEDDLVGIDQMRLIPDVKHTNLDVGFNVPGWEVEYLKARTLNHYYPDRFENDDLYYSRYKVSLGIRRFATSAAFTVFVPALVIVLISLSGLWLPRSEFDARVNTAAPMLAAAVLFHFALTQALPATAYLTRADKVMLGVYACLILNMAATMLWFIFDERHEDRIFKWGRLCVPPVCVMIMLLGSLV